MKNFVGLATIALWLYGCGYAQEHVDLYNEVMMNGEVISTGGLDQNNGSQYTTVKYKGRLWQCNTNMKWDLRICE